MCKPADQEPGQVSLQVSQVHSDSLFWVPLQEPGVAWQLLTLGQPSAGQGEALHGGSVMGKPAKGGCILLHKFLPLDPPWQPVLDQKNQFWQAGVWA